VPNMPLGDRGERIEVPGSEGLVKPGMETPDGRPRREVHSREEPVSFDGAGTDPDGDEEHRWDARGSARGGVVGRGEEE
jgi:hypothetical protein